MPPLTPLRTLPCVLLGFQLRPPHIERLHDLLEPFNLGRKLQQLRAIAGDRGFFKLQPLLIQFQFSCSNLPLKPLVLASLKVRKLLPIL